MYFSVGLHGQATSSCPGASGTPTVCMHGTNSPSAPSTSSTAAPIRVMIFMFTTTYGESRDLHADLGDVGADRAHAERDDVHRPPGHAAVEQPVEDAFISSGSIQLFVGPASSFAA